MTYKFIPAGFEKPPIKRYVIPKDNKLEAKLKEWMEEQRDLNKCEQKYNLAVKNLSSVKDFSVAEAHAAVIAHRTHKIFSILKEALPVMIMIALIPFIRNDYYMLIVYSLIIIISFHLSYDKSDYKIFIFGFIALTVSGLFFISTRVESFNRDSLLRVMPIWLPLLWAYAFVAIKRGINILR